MARFCGIYSPKQPALMQRPLIEQMAAAFVPHVAETASSFYDHDRGFGLTSLSQDVPEGPDWEEIPEAVVTFSGRVASGPYTAERRGPQAARQAFETLQAGGSVEDLAGEFALALWSRGELTLAIDPLGVWPLYYLHDEESGAIVFASEPKCLLEHPLGRREVDPRGLATYLFLTHVAPPLTAYKGMKRLHPGERLTVDAHGTLNSRLDWQYPMPSTEQKSLDEWSAEVAGRHIRHLGNLVSGHQRVGLTLGAGIDSSLLYGRLKTHFPEVEVVPITAYFPPSPRHKYTGLDLPYAQRLAEHWGDRLVEVPLIFSEVDHLLERVLRQTDQPFMNIGNNTALLKLAEVADEHGLSLLIGGQGAGENFGMQSWPEVREHQAQGELQSIEELADFYFTKPLQFSAGRMPKIMRDCPDDLAAIIAQAFEGLLSRVQSPLLFDKTLYGLRPIIPREHIFHSTIAAMTMWPGRIANAFYDWHTASFGASAPPFVKGSEDTAMRKAVVYHHDKHLIPDWVFERKKRGLPGFEFNNGDFPTLEARLLSREVVEAQGVFNPDYFQKVISKKGLRKALLMAQIWLDIHVFRTEETFELIRADRRLYDAAQA